MFPRIAGELRGWHRRAAEIPDPGLRRLALATQRAKRGNPEGAAAFATLAPAAHRPGVVRALVAFQAMYDYLDTLSEQPATDPAANGRLLHCALLVALDVGAPHLEYYAWHPSADDGGYLRALVDACREACGSLPSYAAVAGPARRLAARIVDYQGINSDHGDASPAFARWSRRQVPPGSGLLWWEVAAAAGSSLAVLALVAAAADPSVSAHEADAIEAAYFPWIGGLHTLLDSLIDQPEDVSQGYTSLVGNYSSWREAAERFDLLASESLRRALDLPNGQYHATILAGMASFYLSAPEALLPEARDATRSVIDALGGRAKPALLVLHARRRAAALRRRAMLRRSCRKVLC